MAKLPVRRDLQAYRGSNRKILKFRFRYDDLSGVDFVAVAAVANGQIVARLSDGTLSIDSNGFISWALSAEDSLRIRPGATTQYAIERIDPNGYHYPVLEGVIVGKDYPHVS